MNLQEAIYEITTAYFNNRSIDTIIDKTFEVLGNPIMVMDHRFACIGYMPKANLNNSVWMQIVQDGYANEEYMKRVEEHIRFYDESKIHITQVFEYHEDGKTIRRLVNDISEGTKNLGGIEVLEYYKPYEEWHLELINYVAKLLYTELERSVPHREYDDIESTLLTQMLASNNSRDIYQAQFVAQDLFQNEETYLLAVMPTPRNKKYTLQYLLQNLKIENSKIYLTDYSNFTGLVFHGNELKIEEILKTLEALKNEYELSLIYSDLYNDIYLTKQYFEKAKSLYESNILNTTLTSVYSLKHLTIEEKLLQIDLHDDYLKEQFNTFNMLKSYDELHDSDMLITLETYLKCFLDINETADRLFIHRNTLTYRLKKISSLTKFDLTNKEECLDILLLLRVYNFKTK